VAFSPHAQAKRATGEVKVAVRRRRVASKMSGLAILSTRTINNRTGRQAQGLWQNAPLGNALSVMQGYSSDSLLFGDAQTLS